MSQYIIQRFKPSDSEWKPGEPLVGSWVNTNWGGDVKEEVVERAKEILATEKFAGIRVLENLWEQMIAQETNRVKVQV